MIDSPPATDHGARFGRRFGALAAGFGVAALLQRLAVLNINAAEYTDGILMLGRDLFGATYWPPMYTWCAWAVGALVGGDLELAGRIVSALAGAAAVVPVMWLAARGAHDTTARARLATFAGLLYLASPLAWRWGIRVMSDALFLCLLWGALALLGEAWLRARGGRGVGWEFAAANALGVLASLTRHQGLVVLPLAIAVPVAAVWATRRAPAADPRARTGAMRRALIGLAPLLLWVAWPLTQLGQASAHAGQVTFRAALGGGDAAWSAFMALVNLTESFVYLAPYFVTPLIALFAILGAARRPAEPWGGPPVGAPSLLIAALVLGAQGLFQSYLDRYLLPLLPIAVLYAARGMALAEDAWRPWCFRVALLATLLWGFLFGAAIVVMQREAFGDLKAAAVAMRELGGADATGAPLFSNETYKEEAGLHAIKMTWWAGRAVRPLHELPTRPEPGTLIAVSSAYGGPDGYAELVRVLQERTGARPVGEPFASSLLPLFTDIMQSERGGHQSPVAWVYRFQRQQFRTVVLRVP